MNEELLKEIKETLPWLLAAAIAVGAYYGVKNHLAAKRIAASEAVVEAVSVEELEDAVAKFKGAKSGGVLRLKLAKAYFDQRRYEEALDAYSALEGEAPDGFADIPAMGKAQCLEALGRFDEALAAYDAYVENAPADGYLVLDAKLGSARALSLKGEKDKALEKLEALKDEVKGDELSAGRVEAAIDLVKRYEKREELSLFDAANAAAAQLESEAAETGESASAAEDETPAEPAEEAVEPDKAE